jgi:hypothetical protein
MIYDIGIDVCFDMVFGIALNTFFSSFRNIIFDMFSNKHVIAMFAILLSFHLDMVSDTL